MGTLSQRRSTARQEKLTPMSAVMESQRTQRSNGSAGIDVPVEARTPEPNGAKSVAEATDVRESLSRLSLSPSPTLIFEVDAGGAVENPSPSRRWDVRLVGSVRNRG